MHSNSNNIKFMNYENADEVVEKIFELILNRYQVGLETLMRGIDFINGCVHLLWYKRHKINPNHGGSCIDSPDLIKKLQKTIMNSINKIDNKCFQYAATVALNHEQIKKDSQ